MRSSGRPTLMSTSHASSLWHTASSTADSTAPILDSRSISRPMASTRVACSSRSRAATAATKRASARPCSKRSSVALPCAPASGDTWPSRIRATSATTSTPKAETIRRSTATGPAPKRLGSQSMWRPRFMARPPTIPTYGAAAAAGAGLRCASRTHPTPGTARCRSWAVARSPSTATTLASKAPRSCRSPRCSTCSASWATACPRWSTPCLREDREIPSPG